MDEIDKLIDSFNLSIELVEHSFNIKDCSKEVQNFLEVFSEEEILCSKKYKNHKPLIYKYDESLKNTECKIFLGTYDGVAEYSKVSPEHFEELSKYKWYCSIKKHKSGRISKYAVANINKYNYRMNVFIKGYIKGYVVDHIDGNSLDNNWNNLRHATHLQNAQNKPKRLNCSSKFIGVSYHSISNKWRAMHLKTSLGLFNTEDEAAYAHDKYALLLDNHSKTNKFVMLNDIKNINFDEEYKKNIRELPSNIQFHKNKYYKVRIIYDKIAYNYNTQILSDAIIKRNEFLEDIQNIKDLKQAEHFNKNITRDKNGTAIILSQNDGYFMVDDKNWHNFSQYKWNINNDGYPVSTELGKIHSYIKTDVINEVLSLYPDAEIIVDHIDNNSRNNCENNLRINTKSGNNHNIKSKGKSQFLNVSIKKNKWRVMFGKNYNKYEFGSYDTEIEAGICTYIINRILYKTYSKHIDIDIIYYLKYTNDILLKIEKMLTRKNEKLLKQINNLHI